ncbi:MAG TPA: hypothetical protein VNT26_00145, partial [Candidatus Sulfotelmatobacter sp.]|nr:hypothetical protein [Candidatus Sulfotelmatobacter sp.]
MTLTFATNAPKEDRVRAQTKPEINQRIDTALERRLRFYAAQDKHAMTERLEELDREWDIERVLEANAASLGLLGLFLGSTVSRKWFLLPVAVTGFLLQHAIQGWCPPVPLLRNLGVRTRLEIEQERYALKLLRGDLDNLGRDEAGRLNNPQQLVASLRQGV